MANPHAARVLAPYVKLLELGAPWTPTDKASRRGTIYWLRLDFRLHDNPALNEITRLHAEEVTKMGSAGPVTICYIDSPEEDGPPLLQGPSWRPGGATRLWAQEALAAFDRDLRKKFGPGAGIVFLKGPYLTALRQIAAATNARSVVWNRRYEPVQAVRSAVE